MLLWHFERERPSTEFIIGVIIVRCISHDYTCNLLEGKNVWKKMQNCWKYHHKTYNKSFIFNICFAVSLHKKIEVTHDPIKNCNSCKKSVRHRNSVYQRIEWLWRIHPIHNSQQNFVAACSEPRTEFPSELYLILKVRGGQFLYNPFSFTGNI